MSELVATPSEEHGAATRPADRAAAWPRHLVDDPAPRGTCAVFFVPFVSLEPTPSLSLLLQIAVDGAIAFEDHRWTFALDTEDEANRAADWIVRHQKDAVAASRIGTRAAFEDLDCWMRVGLVQEQLKAEEEKQKEQDVRRKRDEAAAHAKTVESFLVEAEGQFGLDLRRASSKTDFWRIMFRERWERERFRDWFRCQRKRFEEFAAFLDDHDAVALERKLLAEMLETERRIKAAGLGAGGRRPLRFWRGE